jgi:selenide, water dikinase
VRASGAGAEIDMRSVPVIGQGVFDLIAADCIPGGTRDNLAYAAGFTEWNGVSEAEKILLTDAQTSGGLLFCVPERRAEDVLRLLKKLKTPCASVIGSIVRSTKARIKVSA